MEIAVHPIMTKAATETKTCQICERQCKLVRGSISLHGYTRPGCGWINGRCFGAQCPSWEVSCDTLREYVGMLGVKLTQTRESLAHYQSPDLMEVTEYTQAHAYAKPEPKTYKRGERYEVKYMPSTVDMFASIVAGRVQKLGWDIKSLENEIARQEARLASWKAAA